MSFSEFRFGKMPTHWESKRIADYTEIVTDYVANGSFASLKENVTYFEDPNYAVLIRLTDYNRGFDGQFVYIDERAYNFLSKTQLFGGEIIISNVGANVGTVFKAPYLRKKMNLGPNSIMVKTKGNDDFYYYWFSSPNGQESIKSILSGSAQPKFNKTSFRNLELPIPPLNEQKAIAHILSTLDEKIEVNNQINKTLENMAQTIFKQWFVDFEFPNEDGEPYKSSGGEMVESELGMIPKGWKVSTVGELTAIVSKGTTPRKSDIDSATDNNCVKFLKVKDISDHGVIDLKGLEMIPSSIHLNQLKRSVLKYKDVLISIAGTIGRVSYVNEELVNANTNQAVAFIRLKDVEKHFLLMHYKFKSSDFQDSIRSKIVQGVQANISLSVIKDEKLILPDDNVLGLYNNVLNNIFNESNILYKEINSLTNIRDTLLPKLMSGEIRVPLDEECDAS